VTGAGPWLRSRRRPWLRLRQLEGQRLELDDSGARRAVIELAGCTRREAERRLLLAGELLERWRLADQRRALARRRWWVTAIGLGSLVWLAIGLVVAR
jgi:hypothetical protein